MKHSSVKRLITYISPYKLNFFLVLFLALSSVLLSLAIPVYIGDAVECTVRDSTDFDRLAAILAKLGSVILLSAFLQWLMTVCVSKLSYFTVRDIRKDVFAKFSRLPIKYIDGNRKGQLTARVIADIETVADGLLQGFAQLFTGIITIIGTILFMFGINVPITVIVILITPLPLFAAAKIAGLTHKTFAKQGEIRGDMVGLAEELIGGQKIVKALAYEERAEERFGVINEEFKKVGTKAVFYSALTMPVTRFINAVIVAVIGLISALGTTGGIAWIGGMTIGVRFSFIVYLNQYMKPFNEISSIATEFQNALASSERVFKVLDKEEVADDGGKDTLDAGVGTVEFDKVNFSYNPSAPLLKDLNFKAEKGQRVAIVGATGCGKSTIINVLLRFYDINSGDIRVSGKSIYSVSADSLRRAFGMVLQDTWIFTGTVAENIAYGVPSATTEEIETAARTVHAHSFIKRLPNGYGTVISEDSGLSQGQKQLICIARVMLLNPPMLILDEATSSIDLRTEHRIQRAFEKLMRDKTSFIIAHRLSTIKNADVIIVMQNGTIIEKGSHDELIIKNGYYAELFNSQYK